MPGSCSGGISSVGRALDCGSKGHRFETGMSPHKIKDLAQILRCAKSHSKRIVSRRTHPRGGFFRFWTLCLLLYVRNKTSFSEAPTSHFCASNLSRRTCSSTPSTTSLTVSRTACMIARPLQTIVAGRGNPCAYRRESRIRAVFFVPRCCAFNGGPRGASFGWAGSCRPVSTPTSVRHPPWKAGADHSPHYRSSDHAQNDFRFSLGRR